MLANIRKQYGSLCRPAQIYLLISLVAVLAMLFQNITEPHKYCVGPFKCQINFPNILMFIGKLAYIAVWTIVLNSLCKTGYKSLSWFFVLFPLMVFVLLISLFVFSQL